MKSNASLSVGELQSYYAACESGNVEELNLIIKNCGYNRMQQTHGLHLACRNGHFEAVEFLMDKVDLSILYEDKYAIDEAALHGRTNIVKLLFAKSITTQLLKYALRGNTLSTIKFVLKQCDITETESVFQDIRSLEAFQMVMVQIINMTHLNQEARCFLVDGIHYQFRKIKQSINRSGTKNSPTKNVPMEKHISLQEATSHYLDGVDNDNAPPVPNIPRKMSLSQNRHSPLYTPQRKMSLPQPTKSILKSPSNIKSPSSSSSSSIGLPVIRTEEMYAGEKSPIFNSPTYESPPYSLI